MKKKSLVITASLISAFAVALSIAYVSNHISLKKTNADTPTYTMTLDKNNRISSVVTNGDKEGVVRTAIGSEIEMTYSSTVSDPTGQDFIYLDTALQTLKNKTAINGVTRIDYTVTGGLGMYYSYTFDGPSEVRVIGTTEQQMEEQNLQLADLQPVSGSITFGDGEGYPSFFNFTCFIPVHIISLKFYYSCSPSVDPHATTGSWTYETNEDGDGVWTSITLTGYTNPSSSVMNAGVLIIPETIDDGGAIKTVTRIKPGLLDNVGWVEHIVIPFVGQSYLLDKSGLNWKFGSIFPTESAREDYEIMAQDESTWFVPKTLKKVTVYKGNKLNRTASGYVIPSNGFYGTSRLEEINLNFKVTKIGSYAFAYNTGINRLNIPSSIEEIGESAFANCPFLLIRSKGTLEITDFMNPTNCPFSVGYMDTVVANNIVYDICKDSENRIYGNAIRLNSQTASVVDFRETFEYQGYNLGTKRIANKILLNNSYVRTIILPNYLEYVGYQAFEGAYRATIYASENESSVYKTNWRNGVGAYFNNCHDNFYENKGAKYALLTNGIVIYDVNYEASEQTAQTLDFRSVIAPSPSNTVHFAAAFMENNTDVQTIYLDTYVKFENYSFYGCTSLTDIYYDGETSDWNTIVSNLGTNALAYVNATVHCTNGDTTFDGTSMIQ